MRAHQPGARRCLAICRECTEAAGRPAVIPFEDHPGRLAVDERDAWLHRHVQETHGRHDVVGLDGWPGLRAAYRLAFGATR